MLKPITILMTGVGAPGAFGILQCLRNSGERVVRVVGVDMDEHASCRDMVDAFYQVPAADDSAFSDTVLEIAHREHVDVVLPIVTRELMPLATAKPSFEKLGIRVCVLEPEQLKVVNDKAELLLFCKSRGWRVPEFRVAETANEVEAALVELGCEVHPVYVKSAQGNGSRGVRFVDPVRSKYDRFFNEKPDSACMSREEIMAALRERTHIPRMIVMESLPGVEYSADVIADCGSIKYLAVRKSPIVGGSITLESVIVEEPRIAELCELIVSGLELSGSVGFDFRADGQGCPQLMEINPRLTATVVLNAAAGINFPYLCVKHALGEELPEVQLHYGVSVHRRYEERFVDEDGSPLDPLCVREGGIA